MNRSVKEGATDIVIFSEKGQPTLSFFFERTPQQTLSMSPINISLRTLTISCDYLRCLVIMIRLHWTNADIKQVCPPRFASIG